jgi:AcrR family transcriptional regulator
MPTNVVAAYNDVNVYILEYAGGVALRAYHHGNLRSALLERAERIVRERGVQALSLRDLARDVGVSHGAPRRHFPDRGALFDALAESGFERLADELAAAVREAGTSFDARLQALAHAYVAFATRDAALLELMFAAKHRDGPPATRAAADRAFAIPLTVICDAQQDGEVVAGDPQAVARLAFATLHGLATMANGEMLGDDDLGAIVTDAIERLLAGLRPR